MKVTLELNLSDVEAEAISRIYLEGRPVTPEFINEFVRGSLKKLIDDAMIYDVATSGMFEAFKEDG